MVDRERKANRICEMRYPALRLGSSVDLFCHDAVAAAIDTTRLANGIFSALQNARMRVPPQHVEWIIKLIGQERAALCPSLPRAARLNEIIVIDADI
jgi:hypothetical protein